MLKDITPRDWGAFVVSLIILGFFGLYEVGVLYFKVSTDDVLSGILNNLTVLVAGSSKSSQNKDATNAAQAAALAQLSNPPRHPENNP